MARKKYGTHKWRLWLETHLHLQMGSATVQLENEATKDKWLMKREYGMENGSETKYLPTSKAWDELPTNQHLLNLIT